MNLLVFGRGYSASFFLRHHAQAFSSVTATTRGLQPVERIHGVEDIVFDGMEPTHVLRAALNGADAVLVSIPPGSKGDPVLNALANEIAGASQLQKIIYLSTIGIYGDHDGGWVDETTLPVPQSARSKERLAAELGWLGLGRNARKPVQILRLAGIYGPGQNALENLRAGTARRIIKPGQVFNRIHVEDIARAIAAAFEQASSNIWNVSDNEPAPPQDVIEFAARLLGMEPPEPVDFATAAMTSMARSFYSENKRVSNHRLRRELGVELAFPTYREGIAALAAPMQP